MMNRVILIFLFAAVQTSVSQQVFTSEYGFEITFPDYMNVHKGTAHNTAVIASVDANATINIVLDDVSDNNRNSMDDYQLDSFITFMENSLKDYVQDFQKKDYGREVINGCASIYFTYSYLRNAKYLRAKQYYLINNSKIFVITTQCPESEKEDYETVFNACVDSFKFIK